MQGTTHRSSSLNDTATSSPVSLQEAATQKVKVIRAFWIHNTSRSHDHSTPRSFLLVATTTSMQQSLSNASITLIFSHSFQLHLFIPFPCFLISLVSLNSFERVMCIHLLLTTAGYQHNQTIFERLLAPCQREMAASLTTGKSCENMNMLKTFLGKNYS